MGTLQKICEDCRKNVAMTDSFCRYCGRELSKIAFQKAWIAKMKMNKGLIMIKKSGEKTRCDKCIDKKNKWNFCPKCGRGLK